MKRLLLSGLLAVSWLLGGLAHDARADVKLPSVIGSHMVLQRDKPLPIWGWADPGEDVTVQLGENKASTKADARGNWKVTLPSMKADGKAHRLTVSGKREAEREDKDDTYYAYERSFGSFLRTFTLPEGFDADHVYAELKDGVLTIVVPKKPTAQARTIAIKGGDFKKS